MWSATLGTNGRLWGQRGMHFIGNLRLLKLIASAAIASGLLLSLLPQQQAASQQRAAVLPACPVPRPSPEGPGIPIDVCGPQFNFDEFGHMAWQTFKTLAWPAARRDAAASRDGADTDRKLKDVDVGPRVFETYKGDWETFLASAAQPLDWHEYVTKAPPLCKNAQEMPTLGEQSLVLASLHKFGNLETFDLAPNEKPITHLVIAQNGKPVRYLTGFGEKAFKTIRGNELYKALEVGRSDAPPTGKRLFDEGTITIKSAWIEMDGIADPGSFHTRKAWVQNPDPDNRRCDEVEVGLVALHIAHKTNKSPQWIWASFEHVRNVPREGSPTATFHNGRNAMPQEKDGPPSEARTPIVKKPFEMPAPYSIERLKKIPPEIREVNRVWQEALKDSVWKNYELVAIQWPGVPRSPHLTGAGKTVGTQHSALPTPPCRGVFDVNLANSVIETFLQTEIACQENKTCMTCHNLTRNYDFIWSIPLKDNDGAPSPLRKSAISTLRSLTVWSQ